MANHSIFVADVGGTNCRFALVKAQEEAKLTVTEKLNVPTKDFSSFEGMLEQVQSLNGQLSVEDSDLSVFAVPGPVDNKKAALANVAWNIDLTTHIQELDRVHLLNDFAAQAFGCLAETGGESAVIKNPQRTVESGMAAVGPGTGIGHCSIEIHESGTRAHPSECGRWVFPFIGSAERKYQEFLERRTGIIRFRGDMLLSGGGLALLHEFHTGQKLSPSDVAETIDERSAATEWFARFLARDCQHYVLSCFDYCDVLYISGGVAIKNPFLTNNDIFREEFITIDNYREKLDGLGIRLITNEELGLLGCGHFGSITLNKTN